MSQLSEEFQKNLQVCLDRTAPQGSPKAGIFSALLPLLLQLLVQAVDGCMHTSSPATAAATAMKPTPIVKARMRRMMIRDLFDGSPKKYREQGGDDMLEATFQAAAETGPEKVKALIEEIHGAPDPDALSRMG